MSNELFQIRIGAIIRKRRENACLTQSELALMCDVASPRLSLIENGRVDVRLSTLVRIIDALGLGLADISLSPPRSISAADALERRNRNRERIRESGIGPSDPIARLDRKDRRGQDTSAERALLQSD